MGNKKVAVLSTWDFSNYDKKENTDETISTPLKFGYEILCDEYNVDLILPKEKSLLHKILTILLGSNALAVELQIRCCFLSNREYDLIYYPVDRHALLLGGLRKLRLIKVPILLLNHFSFNTNYIISSKKKIFVKLERRVLFRNIDQIVFPCENLMNIAIMDYKVPDKHRKSIGWGASLEYFSGGGYKFQLEKQPYFMAAGSANRDYQTLVEAFCKIDSYTPPLYIFGNGSSEFEKYKDLDQPNIKVFNLRAKGKEGELILRNYYMSALAVLIPIKQINDVPNGATVLVEALAAGRPIVITESDTNYIDVEKENCGLTVKRSDVDDWIRVINYLNTHPEELNEMGSNSKKLATDRYNYKSMGEQLIKIIDTM